MSDAGLQRYIEFFQRLSPGTLPELHSVMTEDVHFVDPFNDVIGLDKVQKIFRHMYSSLENPAFKVTEAALAPSRRGMLRWELSAALNGKPYTIIGMSELGFAADGRVNEHIDHWDASQQFYARLPLIGWLLGLIRARLSV